MTINELLPILILLFVVFILVYTLTTRILESFEYESKMETLGKIAKAMIERGSNDDIENLMNELDREKEGRRNNWLRRSKCV